jgi:1-acyl-sn-glycerol-3-phosphate acyltransferase
MCRHLIPEFLGAPGFAAGRPMNFRDVNPVYSGFLYGIGKFIQSNAFNIIWRRKISGLENVPAFGTPAIFAANHRSLTDPGNAGSCLPYPIFYFAKEELFHVPVLGWYIRRVNSFPVRRKETDIGALKTAVDVLEHGGGLMLFPEGGRRLDPARQFKAKAGVALLASKTGARVIPVGIKNADKLLRFARLEVSFGKAIYPPKEAGRENYQKFADEIMIRIKELCQ